MDGLRLCCASGSPAGAPPAWELIFLTIFLVVVGLVMSFIYYRRGGTDNPRMPGYWKIEMARRHPWGYGGLVAVICFVSVLLVGAFSNRWGLATVLVAAGLAVFLGLAGLIGGYIARIARPQ